MKLPMLCSYLKFQKTIDSGSLTKNQNQRIVRSNYFTKKNFKFSFHERTSDFMADYLQFSKI